MTLRNLNLGPSQTRQRRRRLFFIRFYIVLFFLLVIVFGLAIFSGSAKVTVQTITVSGNAAVSAEDVQDVVSRDLAGRYWYLFSRANSLIFPRAQIRQDLLREIKTIKEADISWTGWQEINVSLTERKPHSVWCGATPASSEPCFLVDKAGYIYAPAPTFSGSLFIKDFSSFASSTSPVGQSFLPAVLYTQVFTLIDMLENRSLKTNALYFDGTDFHFYLEAGPEIIFNDRKGLESSFINLFSALDTGSLDLVKTAGTIKYLDLRFDNKIVIGKNEAK